jgi:hypothetical protein
MENGMPDLSFICFSLFGRCWFTLQKWGNANRKYAIMYKFIPFYSFAVSLGWCLHRPGFPFITQVMVGEDTDQGCKILMLYFIFLFCCNHFTLVNATL